MNEQKPKLKDGTIFIFSEGVERVYKVVNMCCQETAITDLRQQHQQNLALISQQLFKLQVNFILLHIAQEISF